LLNRTFFLQIQQRRLPFAISLGVSVPPGKEHAMALQSDIRVREIKVSPPVYCNCPTKVKVVLVNMGTAAPATNSLDGRFEVCLRSPAFQTETGNVYRQRVLDEMNQLLPGQTMTVEFTNVIFWRTGKQEVTACADCQGIAPAAGPRQFEIVNDVHRHPCLKIQVDVIPAAWLRMEQVVLDLEDSLGNRNRNVQTLCPGGKFVAVATVRNVGCTPAQNFVARLEVKDPAGVVLLVVNVSVLAVLPHVPLDVEFRGTVPIPNAPGAAFIFSVCLDVNHVIAPQCNRLRLCLATPPLPVAMAGPGPLASLIINSASASPLNPGQRIPISWSLQNDCSDVGNVRARVTLKATGDLLYESRVVPVPPRGSGGDLFAFIERPMAAAVARTLYQVGQKMLRLEITGTGNDPGPYVAESPLTISGEAIDDSWWDWDLVSSTLNWKVPYTIGGTFTNRSRGGTTLDLNSVFFREFDDDAGPPVPTGETFAAAPPGALTPNSSVGLTWNNIIQDWVWLDMVGFRVIGPFVRDFGYEATLQLTDEYGNALALVVRLDPGCGVSAEKQLFCDWMIQAAAIATAALIAAGIAFAIPIAGPYISLGLLAVASAALGVALAHAYKANDPPVPDFSYLIVAAPQPRLVPPLLENLPSELAALRSFLELVDRITSSSESLNQGKNKLMAARIDDNPEAIQLQLEACRKSLHVIKMASNYLPAALAEILSLLKAKKALPAEDEMRAEFTKMRGQGIRAELRDLWTRNGLPEDSLGHLEALVRSTQDSKVLPSVRRAFHALTDILLQLTQRTEREFNSVLAEEEQSLHNEVEPSG
jgi:hypothetical protein